MSSIKPIEVARHAPPEITRCRAESCRRPIEWVRVLKSGRRMPVDSPLRAIESFERDGTTITVIDPEVSHFVTCTASASFRRRGRRGIA